MNIFTKFVQFPRKNYIINRNYFDRKVTKVLLIDEKN